MSTEVGAIHIDFLLNDAGFKSALDRAVSKVDEFGNKSENAGRKADRSFKKSEKTLGGLNQRLSRLNKILEKTSIGSGRFDKITAAIGRTNSALDKARSTAIKSGGGLSKITSMMGKMPLIAGGVAAGVALAGTAILKFGAQSSALGAKFESQRIAITTLLNGNEKAAIKLLDAMDSISNRSPHDNADFIQGAKLSVQFGNSAEEAAKQMEVFSDVAAGAGLKVAEVSQIFNKAIADNKVQTDELNQLVERGAIDMAALAKNMGVLTTEIYAMAAAGEITGDVMTATFQDMTSEGGKFFEMAKKQSESFAGLQSTIGGVADSIMADVGLMLNESIKPFLKIFIAGLNQIKSIIKPVRETVVFFIEAITDGFNQFLDAIPDGLKDTIKTVLKFSAAIAFLGPVGIFVIVLSRNFKKLAPVLRQIKTSFDGFTKSVKGIFAELKNLGLEVFNLLKKITPLKKLFDILKNSFKSSKDSVSILTIALRLMFLPISQGFTLITAGLNVIMAGVKLVVDSVRTLARVGTETFNGMAQAMKGNWSEAFASMKSAVTNGTRDMSLNMTNFGGRMVAIARETAERSQAEFASIFRVDPDDTSSPPPALTPPPSAGGGKATTVKTGKDVKVKFEAIEFDFKNANFETIANKISKFFKGGGAKKIQGVLESSMFKPVGGFVKDYIDKRLPESVKGDKTKYKKAFAEAFESLASAIVQSIGKAFDALGKISANKMKTVANKIQSFTQSIGFMSEIMTKMNQNAYDRDLQNFEDTELRKSEILKRESNARQDEIDKESEKKKQIEDDKFNTFIESKRSEFEAHQLDNESRTESDLTRNDNRQRMSESWDRFVEKERVKHDTNIQAIEKEKQKKLESEQKSLVAKQKQKEAAAIAYRDNLQKEKEKKDRDISKVNSLIEYGGQVNSYKMQQQTGRAQIQMDVASGMMSATAAGIEAGWPWGLALTAAMAAMIGATASSSISTLASAPQPLPPTELFFNQGGLIPGGGANIDSIPIMATTGEFVVNRIAAENNLDTLNAINSGGTVGGNTIVENVFIDANGADPEQIYEMFINEMTDQVDSRTGRS